jgi:hypothetical protein
MSLLRLQVFGDVDVTSTEFLVSLQTINVIEEAKLIDIELLGLYIIFIGFLAAIGELLMLFCGCCVMQSITSQVFMQLMWPITLPLAKDGSRNQSQ